VEPAGGAIPGFEDCTGNFIASLEKALKGFQPRRILKRFRRDTKNRLKRALQIARGYALPGGKRFERQLLLRIGHYVPRQLNQLSAAITRIVRPTASTGSEAGMTCLLGRQEESNVLAKRCARRATGAAVYAGCNHSIDKLTVQGPVPSGNARVHGCFVQGFSFHGSSIRQ